MRRALCGLVVALLTLPMVAADDKPQDNKPKREEKKATPREQYDALRTQFKTDLAKLTAEIGKAKGKERKELQQKRLDRVEEIAEQMLRIAEENPKDPAAATAVFWVLQNAFGLPVQAKALEKAPACIADMPLKSLVPQLAGVFDRSSELADAVLARANKEPDNPAALDLMIWVMQNAAPQRNARAKALEKVSAAVKTLPMADLTKHVGQMRNPDPAILELLLQRAEKEAQAPQAPDLLTWVAMQGNDRPSGLKAAAILFEKHPEHRSTSMVCQALSYAGDAPAAEALLKQVLSTTTQPRTKAAATLSLGHLLTRQSYNPALPLDEARKLAGQAETYFTQVKDDQTKEAAPFHQRAEDELLALRKFRVGTDAPEITAADLDRKDFKLSDYRGKVVLLDFWGHW